MKYRFLIIGVIISALAVGVWAAEKDWGFDTASDYTYDTAKIEMTGGVAAW